MHILVDVKLARLCESLDIKAINKKRLVREALETLYQTGLSDGKSAQMRHVIEALGLSDAV